MIPHLGLVPIICRVTIFHHLTARSKGPSSTFTCFPHLCHPFPQLPPYCFLFLHAHPGCQSAGSCSHKDWRSLPLRIVARLAHVLFFWLPPISKLFLPDRPSLADPPHSFPNALPYQAHSPRALSRYLGVQHGNPRIHFTLAEHPRIPRRSLDDVGVSDPVQFRQSVGIRRRMSDAGNS